MLKKFDKCPICGDCGEDLVFKFYCYNKKCQNYHPFCDKDGEIVEDIELDLDFNHNPFTNWPYRDDDD